MKSVKRVTARRQCLVITRFFRFFCDRPIHGTLNPILAFTMQVDQAVLPAPHGNIIDAVLLRVGRGQIILFIKILFFIL